MTLPCMNLKDRQRQRDTRPPQGRAPNWLMWLVAGAVTAGALVARSLV
jgi:hypothetical protein